MHIAQNMSVPVDATRMTMDWHSSEFPDGELQSHELGIMEAI